MLTYLAHGGEEHSTAVEGVSHQLIDKPIVLLLLICAGICVLAAGAVFILGRKQTGQAPDKDKDSVS